VTVHAQTTPDIEITPDQQTELEPLYRVLIHNDDVTPMDFVTHILISIFFLGYPKAVEIMLDAHRNGMSVVQILPKAISMRRLFYSGKLSEPKTAGLSIFQEPGGLRLTLGTIA
jgi:ATP-dependent Clp protease adaptor protein ClpS